MSVDRKCSQFLAKWDAKSLSGVDHSRDKIGKNHLPNLTDPTRASNDIWNSILQI
jgi:hypothetical protein